MIQFRVLRVALAFSFGLEAGLWVGLGALAWILVGRSVGVVGSWGQDAVGDFDLLRGVLRRRSSSPGSGRLARGDRHRLRVPSPGMRARE